MRIVCAGRAVSLASFFLSLRLAWPFRNSIRGSHTIRLLVYVYFFSPITLNTCPLSLAPSMYPSTQSSRPHTPTQLVHLIQPTIILYNALHLALSLSRARSLAPCRVDGADAAAVGGGVLGEAAHLDCDGRARNGVMRHARYVIARSLVSFKHTQAANCRPRQ